MFNRHKQTFALLMAWALSCGPGQLSAEELAPGTGNRITNSAISNLSAQAEDRSLGEWERDANDNVISLRLYWPLANDTSLDIFSKLGSIQRLSIQGRFKTPGLTREGISSLARMTNLVSLRFACSGPLKSGVFEEVCKLKELRELHLFFADPPSEEYAALTNLQYLGDLRVIGCTNFGDLQLSLLTNLPTLKSLTLADDGFSRQGTNVLHAMTGLTNVAVKVSQPWTSAE